MIINNVLDEIFSGRSNSSVLRILCRIKIGISGREIARRAGISSSTCKQTLLLLENLGLITRLMGRREHLITLNRDSYIVKNIIIPSFEIERKFRSEIFKAVADEIGESADSIILFGSTARHEETVESDFDICIIYTDLSKRRKIEKKMSYLYSRLFTEYGISVSPLYYSSVEFRRKNLQKKSPITEIVREGEVITGISIEKVLHGKEIHKKTGRPI